MRSLIILFAVAALSGCATSQSDITADYRQRLALYKDAPVALPSKTPFDDDSAARGMYLDWYRDGYRSGLTGIFITCCFPPGPHPQAQQRGWADGQLLGLNAAGERRFSETR
jgi:hypothetical protein